MNKKQQRTLDRIRKNPVRSNIKWSDIESLFEALGAELHGGGGRGMRKILGPYKHYYGTIEIDFESYVLHGEVIGLKDVITYEGKTVDELEQSFKNSVNAYLKFCKKHKESPEKPYSGKFNLRIAPELHKQLAFEAALLDKSLNSYVEEILYGYISDNSEPLLQQVAL